MPTAIYTLLKSDAHRARWETYSRATWEAYAHKHGLAIVLGEGVLDTTPEANERSHSWQKLLLFRDRQLEKFDRVIWLDSDLIINLEAAPDVTSGVPEEKIGATIVHLMLAYPGMGTALKRICGTESVADHARQFYESNSLPAFDYYISNSVLVLSRSHHAAMLEEVYDTYPEQKHSFQEQMALSSVVLQRELLQPLDPRFNAIWYEHKTAFYPFLLGGPAALKPLCLAAVYANCYFLNFLGEQDDAAMFQPSIQINRTATSIPKSLLMGIADSLDKLARAPDTRAGQQRGR